MPELAVTPMETATMAHRRSPFLILLGLVSIPIVLLDQLTKHYVSTHMAIYQTIPIIPHWLDITYTRNSGAAFSMFTGLPPWFRGAFLTTLAATAILVLIVLIARSERVTLTSFAFALILAGAGGNLIDRSLYGQVIDFIRAHYYDWNYPIFNVADSAISIGVATVLLSSVFSSKQTS